MTDGWGAGAQAAEEKHEAAISKEGLLSVQRAELIENKAGAEAALAEAMPMVEEAEGALQRVTKAAIDARRGAKGGGGEAESGGVGER